MALSPNESSGAGSARQPMLAVLNGERLDPPPVWMMRQAGRYLPEYRQLRSDKGSFLDLVYDSDAAAEVTLQPLKRFPELDAAILFSDILIVPFAIGQNLSFVAGEGPRLTPPLANAAPESLQAFPARLEPIYETVRKVKDGIASDHPVARAIGADRGSLGLRQLPGDRLSIIHARLKRGLVDLSEDFIQSYLDAEWPEVGNCVGVFRIEGRGIQLFDRIIGGHFTIMGMPLIPVLKALRKREILAR